MLVHAARVYSMYVYIINTEEYIIKYEREKRKRGEILWKKKERGYTEAKIKMKCKINVKWTKLKEKRCAKRRYLRGRIWFSVWHAEIPHIPYGLKEHNSKKHEKH